MRPTPGANLPAAVARFLRDAPHSNQSMAHLAEKLIENGYPIIPVQWGRKSPLLDGWTRDWERPPTIEQVNGWLAHWPACGVGIPCGWVIAIDIDILDQKLAARIRQLALDVLGSTSLVRIGQSPKLLLVYRSAEPFETMNEGPIQILGKGAQFVAYNLHEVTGRPYDWPVDNLVDIPLADLPLVTQEACRTFLARVWDILPASLRGAKQKADRVVRVIPDHGKRRGTMRALGEALNWIDNSGEGLHYDEWIKRLLGVSHSLGLEGLSIIEGWSAQSTKNRPEYTCSTYLSLRPDGRYKAGSIYRDAMSNGWSPDYDITLDADVEEAVAEVDLSGLFDEGGKFRQEAKPNGDGRHVSEPEPEPEPPEPEPTIQLPTLKPNLELIPHPGGVLEELAGWMTSTAKRPQPELAMGAAIALVGFMGAHLYRLVDDGDDTRTNVIVVGLAPSASGKDHARRCIAEVMRNMDTKTGMISFLGEDMASGQALEGAFVDRFGNLVMIDEYGHRLATALQKGGSPNDRKLIEVITKLSTSASRTYVHTRRAMHRTGGPPPVTHDPCLAMYNTTVEEPLWQALSSGSVTDGSLARHLFFRTREAYPSRPGNIPHLTEMRGEMVEHCRRVFCGSPNQVAMDIRIGDLQAQYDDKVRLSPSPPWALIDVPLTPEARNELRRIYDQEIELLRHPGMVRVQAICGRLLENTKTLALICASSQDPVRPVITAAHVLWGEAVARQSIEIVAQAIELHVADTPHHALSQKMLACIRKASGGAWVRKRDITQVTRWCDPKLRQSLIADLVEARLVEIKPDKTKRKGGSLSYFIRST